MKTTLLKNILLFSLGSLGFLMIPSFFGPGLENGVFRFEHPMFRHEFFSQILLLLFFYSNYFILLPRLFGKGKKSSYWISTLGCLLLIISLAHLLTPISMPFPPKFNGAFPGDHLLARPAPIPAMHLGATLFFFLLITLLSMNIHMGNEYKKAMQEKTDAELSYLKAQVNPHFLFNTLNSLYALSLEKSDQTPDAILQLSNMMRYVLTDAEKEKVPLENELHFLRNFFALQQLRFGKNIRLHFEESGDPKGLSIAPLMLIPFVENAFKHGVHTEEPSEISIFTRIAEQSIFLEVRNNKVTPQQRPEEQSGKGIANVRLRLHHLYPGKHVLKIDDNPKTYSVSLKIQLT